MPLPSNVSCVTYFNLNEPLSIAARACSVSILAIPLTVSLPGAERERTPSVDQSLFLQHI
jgi:hypothetical protein